jgi:hypothetical protein
MSKDIPIAIKVDPDLFINNELDLKTKEWRIFVRNRVIEAIEKNKTKYGIKICMYDIPEVVSFKIFRESIEFMYNLRFSTENRCTCNSDKYVHDSYYFVRNLKNINPQTD